MNGTGMGVASFCRIKSGHGGRVVVFGRTRMAPLDGSFVVSSNLG
jgi:hypothetical protein